MFQYKAKEVITLTEEINDEIELTEFLAKFKKLTEEQKKDIINQIITLSSCPSSL